MKTKNTSDYADRDIEAALLDHARLGLKRIHTVCGSSEVNNDQSNNAKINGNDQQEQVKIKKPKTQKKVSIVKEQENEKKTKYISTKKPVEKSIFYQHSRQGMKYWYEEQKSKSYSSKVPMGRKGTLLGLVDAPLK